MRTAKDRLPITAPETERQSLQQIMEMLRETSSPKLIGLKGEAIDLPPSVAALLQQGMAQLAQGETVVVLASTQKLSTQEAALVLHVSRPYLIKLLEDGTIPFTKVGSHRRIHLQDVLAYKQKQDAIQREALRTIGELTQEMGLYTD